MPSWKAIIQKNKARLLETKEEKETRLHNAVDNNKILEIRMLLQDGTDVNCRGDLAEWTPLHVASSCGHLEIIKLLLSFNATIDIPDKFGSTPLFYAIKNHHTEAVQLLLDKNADATIRNKWGEAAADFAEEGIRGVMDLGDDLVESFTTMDYELPGNRSPSESARKKYPSHLVDTNNQKMWIAEGVMESFASMDEGSPRILSQQQQSPAASLDTSPRSYHK